MLSRTKASKRIQTACLEISEKEVTTCGQVREGFVKTMAFEVGFGGCGVEGTRSLHILVTGQLSGSVIPAAGRLFVTAWADKPGLLSTHLES